MGLGRVVRFERGINGAESAARSIMAVSARPVIPFHGIFKTVARASSERERWAMGLRGQSQSRLMVSPLAPAPHCFLPATLWFWTLVNHDLFLSRGCRRSRANAITGYRGMTDLAKVTERGFPIRAPGNQSKKTRRKTPVRFDRRQPKRCRTSERLGPSKHSSQRKLCSQRAGHRLPQVQDRRLPPWRQKESGKGWSRRGTHRESPIPRRVRG
jgi:hypothetical protein